MAGRRGVRYLDRFRSGTSPGSAGYAPIGPHASYHDRAEPGCQRSSPSRLARPPQASRHRGARHCNCGGRSDRAPSGIGGSDALAKLRLEPGRRGPADSNPASRDYGPPLGGCGRGPREGGIDPPVTVEGALGATSRRVFGPAGPSRRRRPGTTTRVRASALSVRGRRNPAARGTGLQPVSQALCAGRNERRFWQRSFRFARTGLERAIRGRAGRCLQPVAG